MIFTIKAGRHSANNWLRWRILWGNTLRFRYRFHHGADYDPAKVLNGWSKLFGFASPFVHRNSIRVVWKNTDTGLKAGLYAYVCGESPQENPGLKKEIATIYPALWNEVVISRKGKGIQIIHGMEDLRPDTYVMPYSGWRLPIHFICHPYVGGKFTLDNNVCIEIERVTSNQ